MTNLSTIDSATLAHVTGGQDNPPIDWEKIAPYLSKYIKPNANPVVPVGSGRTKIA